MIQALYMRFRITLILLFLSLAISPPLFCQIVYSNFPPQDIAWLKSQGWPDEKIKNAVLANHISESPREWEQLTNFYHTAHFNIYQVGPSNVFVPTAPENQWSLVDVGTGVLANEIYRIPPQDVAYLKQQGWSDWEIANARPVQAITNSQGAVISSQDVAELTAQGWSDSDIANAQQVPTGTNSTLQTATSPTPPDLKGAIIYMDSFLGMANQTVPGDVISMRSQALKFRLMGKDYDYSGNYAVILNTPRQHRNPYFGLGSPETANILVLEDVGGQTFPLPNATIWQKEANFIDAVSGGKEWIYSGTYSIQK